MYSLNTQQFRVQLGTTMPGKRNGLQSCPYPADLLQILSTEQWAAMCVQSYPYFPSLELALEGLAKEGGGSTMSEVLAAAQQNALQDEWAALNDYVGCITKQYYTKHVPIFRPRSIPRSLQYHSCATGSQGAMCNNCCCEAHDNTAPFIAGCEQANGRGDYRES